MLPVVQIGPAAIQLPGLCVLAGLWIGANLVEKSALRHQISAPRLTTLILVGLVSAILGARLGYALRHLNVYVDSPGGLLSLDPGTLAVEEGVLMGLIGSLVYATRQRLPMWPTLDVLTPGLAVFGVALGFSHLAAGDAYGTPATIPWAIELWGELRHPSQVYEIAAGAGILGAVLWADGRFPFEGFIFLMWVGLAALSRLFLEAFRGDSSVLVGSVRSAQVVSLVVLIAAMAALRWKAGSSIQQIS